MWRSYVTDSYDPVYGVYYVCVMPVNDSFNKNQHIKLLCSSVVSTFYDIITATELVWTTYQASIFQILSVNM